MAELPKSPLSLYGPGTYTPSRSKQVAALQNYLSVVKFLLPLDKAISSAVLWHPDLHSEHIFVHPERPSEVLAIIDWQSSEVLPLFDQARQPYVLAYDGPSYTGLDPPFFPGKFDQLDPVEQARAQRMYLDMSLSALYRRFTYAKNERLFRAVKFRESSSFELMLLAQNLLVDGETLYRSRMLELERDWSSLPGVRAAGNPAPPVRCSADEAKTVVEDAAGVTRAMKLMQTLKKSLGKLWPDRRGVPHEEYNRVKLLMSQAKAEMVNDLARSEEERAEWEKPWPYPD